MPHAIEPSKILKESFERLNQFHEQLKTSIVTPSEITTIIDFLHKESTNLNRHTAQDSKLKEKISTTDKDCKNDILSLIRNIIHSPACNQALGSQQMEFSNLLRKFEQAIHKWESKVEKVENNPLK